MIGLFEFHMAHSEILLQACADESLCNSSLIKLCSTCTKQNAAVKTASIIFISEIYIIESD